MSLARDSNEPEARIYVGQLSSVSGVPSWSRQLSFGHVDGRR